MVLLTSALPIPGAPNRVRLSGRRREHSPPGGCLFESLVSGKEHAKLNPRAKLGLKGPDRGEGERPCNKPWNGVPDLALKNHLQIQTRLSESGT